MNNKVEIIPPSFGLQRKLGAPIKQTPHARLAAADKALGQQAEEFDAYFQNLLNHWRNSGELSVSKTYQDAHDVRCMAGTFQRAGLGRIADALCAYIDAAVACHSEPDPETIKALRDALAACAHLESEDPEASARISASACDAVQIKIAALHKT